MSYDLDPIDIVENLAEERLWNFDRVAEDQIAMAYKGLWREYSITIAWNAYDQTLRLVCTFELEPPPDRTPALYEILNLVNDMCWSGAFTWWEGQNVMVYRSGLNLAGDTTATPEQVDVMLEAAVLYSERFFPAFELAMWGTKTSKEALGIAIAEAYGTA